MPPVTAKRRALAKTKTCRHLARARRMFGQDAIVTRKPASKFDPGQGNLSGKCSTCFKPGCRRKWTMTIATSELGGMFNLVKGQGHTWKDAWSRAESP